MPLTPVTIRLGDAEIAALDRYIAASHYRRTREQALAEIVTRWAAAQARRPAKVDEGLRPEELNASNDS